MPLEVTVGPPRLSINQGYGFLVTEQDGSIPWPSDKGLYHDDTRMVSNWTVYADGQEWNLLNSGCLTYYASRIFLTNKQVVTPSGTIPEGSLALTVSRCLSGGLHEDLDLANHGQSPARFNLEIVVRCDFADLFEVKAGTTMRRGQITTTWSARAGRLTTKYKNGDFARTLMLSIDNANSKAVYANGRLSFQIDLAPGATWHACLLYGVGDGGRMLAAPPDCDAVESRMISGQLLDKWRDMALKARTSHAVFNQFFDQSLMDIAALRLPIDGTDHLEFVPAAGVPWFVALFGRDSLIISLQNAMVYPRFSRGALDVLGRLQATERDDWRDAQPGKILHEMRRGELAHFKLIPHTPYYGSADTTILYLMVLHNAWRCLGEHDLVKGFMPYAERCLTWIDNYGDMDGDGFQEWQTRSNAGLENQDWKDSGDSFVYEDGTKVKGPKAACELQGYVYDAWLRMAQIYDSIDERPRAAILRDRAKRLFDRFNETFWDEKSEFYAFCLDGDKRPVMSVTSNAGQLLWTGIVPPERAAKVVKRLMQPDMSTGWGIRTLSSEHPAFNPNAYQLGSVWPHDNAIIASGFRRYGFIREAHKIAADITNAAGYFTMTQMPELYSGMQREPLNFPVQYLGANVPQGWAAGACFHLLQMIVGFQPDAPRGMLFLDPALPDWMTELEIRDLRVGPHVFDIRFWREKSRTRFKVLKGDPDKVARHKYALGPARWD